ncbi:hypothetical protein [Sphingomonas sp. PR090111-T3T-6A]|uniref:hypothetical protein n=1 Tax=Sphingomonas sp. PR090111-T3T-6A TaxID=685778 RepID=UPI00037739CE|nr:hypothetical protein [Sphingomonas sp. PR090111-T3T-6A]
MNASARLVTCAAFGLLLATAAAPPALAHSSSGQHRAQLSDGSTITYDAETNQYCWTHSTTGSNLSRRECHSRQEWAELGLQISGK